MPVQNEDPQYQPELGWRLPNGNLLVIREDQCRHSVVEIEHRHPQYRKLAEIVRRNRSRWQPIYDLREAASHGDLLAVEKLVADGVSPNALLPWSSDSTPLSSASGRGQTFILQVLLNHGADVDHQNPQGWTALMSAAYCHQEGSVRTLLEWGANAALVSCCGRTALDWARIGEGCYPIESTAADRVAMDERCSRTIRELERTSSC